MTKPAGFHHYAIGDGVDAYLLPTKRFKTATLKVHLHRPLADRTTAGALLLYAMKRGCRGFVNLRKILAFMEDLYGAGFGAGVFRLGERQVLGFKLELVSDRYLPARGNLSRGLDFLRRMVLQPVAEKGGLSREHVRTEKEALRHEIEGLINDRGEYAHKRCIEEMCRAEPYGVYEIGRVEDLEALDARKLLALHKELTATAPIVVLGTGDFDPDALARAIAKAFKLGRRKVAAPPPPVLRPAPKTPRRLTESMDVEQAKLVIGCRTGTRMADPDHFPLLVFNALLGAFPHSRLFVNVREKENLAYYAHSWLDGSKGLLFVSAGINAENADKAVKVIQRQIDDLANGTIGDDEWTKTKTALIDRVNGWHDDPAARMGALVEMLANGVAYGPDEVAERIKSVTRRRAAAAGAKVAMDTVYVLAKP